MAKKRKPKLPPLLDWMRAKKKETIIAYHTTWESRCRVYKIVESVGKFSEMVTIYYSIVGNTIIGKSRRRGPAERICNKHAWQPDILKYHHLVKDHGVDSTKAKAFKKYQQDNKVFQLRVITLGDDS